MFYYKLRKWFKGFIFLLILLGVFELIGYLTYFAFDLTAKGGGIKFIMLLWIFGLLISILLSLVICVIIMVFYGFPSMLGEVVERWQIKRRLKEKK